MLRAHALLLVAALALTACGAPRCRNRIDRRVPSPDASRDAVLYDRDCGEGPSTAVAVIPHAADLPDLPTNVLGLSRATAVTANWASATELHLAYPATATVIGRMDRTSDGVSVRFDPR